ncbi:MAG: hypothetical protein HY898_08600 [Deltaproteobacteria bacterium]|nr:hypothetical protein [Deltaproteobacteria bacterium]
MRGVLLLAASILALCATACSSSDSTPEKLCGGVVRDGQCYKKCDETKCLAGNYCFVTDDRAEGFCGQPCKDPNGTECGMGYACTPGTATTVDLTTYDYYCKSLGLPNDGVTGSPCKGDAECAPGYGLQCLAGKCAVKCDGVQYCPDGYECKGIPNAPASGPKGYCDKKDTDWGAGHYGTECPSGKSTVCDSANGWICVGTLGKGFCSKKDGCATDDDCPSGYWCGSARIGISGKTDIDFTQQPKVCLKREFCAPCNSDIDCSLQVGAICVPDKNGEGFCTTPCEKETNSCYIGVECKDVGTGVFACVPDVGACHEATPQGCSPCRVDTDCGQNAICADGDFGYKTGMSWCMTPCGPKDSFGKATCNIAPNGLEMMCMDETELGLGGPFKNDGTTPNYLYGHCYAPFTVDNTEMFVPSDPPRNVCGNYVREGDEECDDGNGKDSDGCDTKCKVTAACTFAIKEPNGDVWDTPPSEPALDPAPNHVTGTDYDPRMQWVVSTTKCRTFKITGALETAGDIDTIALELPDGAAAWLDTYNGGIGKCGVDLRTEVRPWGNAAKTADLNLLDATVTCEGLSDVIKNLDAATPSLCSNKHLGCGSCTKAGICGACDDDNGYGDCTRMMLSTTLTYGSYPIDFDGKFKIVRVYAKDPAATVSEYTMVVSRFTASNPVGASTPPGLTCY